MQKCYVIEKDNGTKFFNKCPEGDTRYMENSFNNNNN